MNIANMTAEQKLQVLAEMQACWNYDPEIECGPSQYDMLYLLSDWICDAENNNECFYDVVEQKERYTELDAMLSARDKQERADYALLTA